MFRVALWTMVIFTASTVTAYAQKDTSGKGVDILSSFRPTIRESAKVNFYPGQLIPDTVRPRFQYAIPNQQLSLAYSATSLKPLAYTIDSFQRINANPYLKLGYGNMRTPYIKAGYSWGDGYTKGAQVTASHISSKGKLASQQYSSTEALLSGFRRVNNRPLRIDGEFGFAFNKLNKYGYTYWASHPDLSYSPPIPPVDSIRQHFLMLSGKMSLSSVKTSESGVSYTFSGELVRFSDKIGNAETRANLQVPIQKMIGDDWRVDIVLYANWVNLNATGKKSISSSLVSLSPYVRHWTNKFSIQAGLLPIWDNKNFRLLPSVNAAVNSADKRFALQFGWEGTVLSNSYQTLAAQNPWLWLPVELRNTMIDEKYIGIKATVGNHFYAGLRGGYAVLNNLPLFINDTSATADGKSFQVLYEHRLRRAQLKGEAGYRIADRFHLGATLTINQFGGQKSQPHAWGQVPMELNSSVRVEVLKDLWLKADFFAWRGARYLQRSGADGRLKGAVDFNTALEFKLTKSVRLWAQFNNLFNSTYQRWFQYPVYGFNCTAGVVFSPGQKN